MHIDSADAHGAVHTIAADVEIGLANFHGKRVEGHRHGDIGRARVFIVAGVGSGHGFAAGDCRIDRRNGRSGTSNKRSSRVNCRIYGGAEINGSALRRDAGNRNIPVCLLAVRDADIGNVACVQGGVQLTE